MSGGDVAQIPATIDDANEAWLSEVMGTEVRQRQVTFPELLATDALSFSSDSD